MRRSFPIVLPLLLLGVLPSCPKPVVLGPISYGSKGRITDASVVLDSILARRDRFKTVRGEAKVSIESPQGSGKISEFIVACPPALLRLESVSFFGNPIAVLTSDGQSFALHDIEHHKFYEGPATAQNVSRLLPAAFRAEDITSLLVGVPPLLVVTDSMTLDVDETARMYKLVLKTGGAVEIIGLDPATLRPLKVWMNAAAGITAYEATLGDYDDITDLPRSLQVVTKDPQGKLELRWRDREVNVEMPVNIFRQPVPPDTERIPAG